MHNTATARSRTAHGRPRGRGLRGVCNASAASRSAAVDGPLECALSAASAVDAILQVGQGRENVVEGRRLGEIHVPHRPRHNLFPAGERLGECLRHLVTMMSMLSRGLLKSCGSVGQLAWQGFTDAEVAGG